MLLRAQAVDLLCVAAVGVRAWRVPTGYVGRPFACRRHDPLSTLLTHDDQGVAMPPPRNAGRARWRASGLRTRSVTTVTSGWVPPLASAAACQGGPPREGGGQPVPAVDAVAVMSTTIVSPSSTRAIGPPRKASGPT